MNRTKIEWTHRPGTTGMTWNPIRFRGPDGKTGTMCSHCSPGCAHCYAEIINKRFGTGRLYNIGEVKAGEFYIDKRILAEPLKRKKPATIFVMDMGDLFHEAIPDALILSVFEAMRLAPQHVFQVLTKRTERMSHFGVLADYTMAHVWPGTSIENEEMAALRIQQLCATRTLGKRFLSVEPMLEAIDLRGKTRCADRDSVLGCISWVIVGGESGPGARPFHIAWAEALLGQCRAARVPFFMKQLGSSPRYGDAHYAMSGLRDRKGGDPLEWPEHLRVREFP